MSEMEYHEIGEIFEYDGVVLEVKEENPNVSCCFGCYFKSTNCVNMFCYPSARKDNKYIIYELVEQCKQKDIKQKTEIERIMEERQKIEQKTDTKCDEEIYGSLLDRLFTTYKAKDRDYGSAFSEMFDELGIDYAYGKLREKMNRIKVLRNQPNMVENEGLEDALLDTAGYAILTLVELKKRKQ